jgi:hypothetical protein
MSFGLKNIEAIYQWAMVILFHDMIRKDIKVCVDDMIVKIQMEESYMETLRKLFERLGTYELK